MSSHIPCWVPPKPESIDCASCKQRIFGAELAISFDAAIAHIADIAGGLGPCPMRLDICSCSLQSCSPCGLGGCGGTLLDLGGHTLNTSGEGCCYYDENGTIIEDPTSWRPPLLAANICGTVHELEYGTAWIAEGDCIRILCDIPGLKAGSRSDKGPNYQWDATAAEWTLVDVGCADTLTLYGTFGKTLTPLQWACLNDLVCWHWEQKYTDCETTADRASSVRHTGPDGSTEYTFNGSPFENEPWATGKPHLDRTLSQLLRSDFCPLLARKPTTVTKYRVHATAIN